MQLSTHASQLLHTRTYRHCGLVACSILAIIQQVKTPFCTHAQQHAYQPRTHQSAILPTQTGMHPTLHVHGPSSHKAKACQYTDMFYLCYTTHVAPWTSARNTVLPTLTSLHPEATLSQCSVPQLYKLQTSWLCCLQQLGYKALTWQLSLLLYGCHPGPAWARILHKRITLMTHPQGSYRQQPAHISLVRLQHYVTQAQCLHEHRHHVQDMELSLEF